MAKQKQAAAYAEQKTNAVISKPSWRPSPQVTTPVIQKGMKTS